MIQHVRDSRATPVAVVSILICPMGLGGMTLMGCLLGPPCGVSVHKHQ